MISVSTLIHERVESRLLEPLVEPHAALHGEARAGGLDDLGQGSRRGDDHDVVGTPVAPP